MTPQAFIATWGPGGPASGLNEEQGAQSHFLDLCELLGVAKPGSEPGYLFEQGSRLAGQASGFADVYKRGAFAWENKAPGKNLDAALRQLQTYSLALDNPPLLVVCDRLSIRIHTQFNGHPSERHDIALADLAQHDKRELLKRVWTAPESFRPRTTNRDITEAAAKSFATLAERLRARGNSPDAVAHFLTQCMFCCFAEDVNLLPGKLFDRLINTKTLSPERLGDNLGKLFEAMKSGGLFGVDDVPWFNGGLFQTIAVPRLDILDVIELKRAAEKNWSAIDVSIFGTLFERGLDPAKRSQLGAHYTDPATIERIIDPVVRRPLLREWAAAKEQIAARLEKSKKRDDKAWRDAAALHIGFLQRLAAYRVLDPACGSGNFLYLALKCLKDVEHLANTEAEALGLERQVELFTGPANVLGIELNEYAAELARVTVWIGELQWRLDHGHPFKTNPVLEPLDHIECRDALLSWSTDEPSREVARTGGAEMGSEMGSDTDLAKPNSGSDPVSADPVSVEPGLVPANASVRAETPSVRAEPVEASAPASLANAAARAAQTPGAHDPLGARTSPPASAPPAPPRVLASEAPWPRADVVVGNPPFLGVSRKRGELGEATTRALDAVFAPGVPGAADLVCYWFAKALKAMQSNDLRAAGFVATNSIRGGANRRVLDAIAEHSTIFEAWSDEPWVNDGAAVRVSLVCFGEGIGRTLNGLPVPQIYADLTAPATLGDSLNLSKAMPLANNGSASFQGASKKAKFEIDAALARDWLRLPNPHGRSNSDVLKPWANGFELSRGPQHQWIIDFGNEMTEGEASLYEEPFAYVVQHIKPDRITKSEPGLRDHWWRFGRPRVELRLALKPLQRFIATVAHSKHRFFVWLPVSTSPDQALITVARADDTTFGILHSRFHELWSLRMGTSLEDRPRYTPTTCFETFPFPEGLTPADAAHQQTEALASGARIPAQMADATLKAAASRIAEAAKTLNERREAWLNPPEWTVRVPEVTPLGMDHSPYPDRILPKPGLSEADAKALQKRTLTNLYNTRPAWLAMAHAELDAAVAAAYGWTDFTPAMPDDELLARLLALNLARSG
jgi:hypothetical protein